MPTKFFTALRAAAEVARKQTRYIEFHPYREDAAVLRIDANPLTDTAGSKPYPVYFQNVIHGTYLRRR